MEGILVNADLSGADLSNADLSNADLSNADLSNADLSFADLRAAKLTAAKLTSPTDQALPKGFTNHDHPRFDPAGQGDDPRDRLLTLRLARPAAACRSIG